MEGKLIIDEKLFHAMRCLSFSLSNYSHEIPMFYVVLINTQERGFYRI